MFLGKTIELYRKEGLYLKYLKNKGRGLFCKYDINANEIIEVTPLFIFNKDKQSFIQDSFLRDYVFKALEISPGWFAAKDGKCNTDSTLSILNILFDFNLLSISLS